MDEEHEQAEENTSTPLRDDAGAGSQRGTHVTTTGAVTRSRKSSVRDAFDAAPSAGCGGVAGGIANDSTLTPTSCASCSSSSRFFGVWRRDLPRDVGLDPQSAAATTPRSPSTRPPRQICAPAIRAFGGVVVVASSCLRLSAVHRRSAAALCSLAGFARRLGRTLTALLGTPAHASSIHRLVFLSILTIVILISAPSSVSSRQPVFP